LPHCHDTVSYNVPPWRAPARTGWAFHHVWTWSCGQKLSLLTMGF
jgi:hypothetical protein